MTKTLKKTSNLKRSGMRTWGKTALLSCLSATLLLSAKAQITINNDASLTALSMGFNGYNPPAQLRYVGGTVSGWAVSASNPLLAPTSTLGSFGYNLPSPTATTTVSTTYTSYGDARVNAFNGSTLVAYKDITIYPRDVEVPGSISFSAGNIAGSKNFTATGNRWVNSASYYSWGVSAYNASNYTVSGSGATGTVTPQPWAPFNEYVVVYCYFVPNGAPFDASQGYLPYGVTPVATILRDASIRSNSTNNMICSGSTLTLTVDAEDNVNAGTYIPGGISTATGPQYWRLKHFTRQWYKNGVLLSGETNTTLNASSYGAGSYHCYVRQYDQVASGSNYVWYSTTSAEKTTNTIVVSNPTATSSFTPNFTINSTAVSATPLNVYFCNPITFTSTSTGSGNTGYSILVQQGTTTIYSTGIVNSPAPAAFDLKSVANLSAGGVYDITYTLYNQCNAASSTVKTGKINVQTPTASSSLQTNATTLSSIDVSYAPASTTSSSPNDVGPVSTTFVINGSYTTVPATSPVCQYKYHVERWDGGSTWTPFGVTTAKTSACSLALVKTIGINVAAGGAATPYKDFFEDPANAADMSIWRLVVELTNDCGTNTQYAVFRLNRGGYERRSVLVGDSRSNSVSFTPVPFTSSVTAHLSVAEAALVNMQVYAIDGRLVSSIKDRSMSAGDQKLDIPTADWAPGIYFYTCTIGDQSFSGKIVRQ